MPDMDPSTREKAREIIADNQPHVLRAEVREDMADAILDALVAEGFTLIEGAMEERTAFKLTLGEDAVPHRRVVTPWSRIDLEVVVSRDGSEPFGPPLTTRDPSGEDREKAAREVGEAWRIARERYGWTREDEDT